MNNNFMIEERKGVKGLSKKRHGERREKL